MFPSGEAAHHQAGHWEEGHQVARDEHGPGSPGVVGEQDSNTGHQVEVTNHNLKIKQHFYQNICYISGKKCLLSVLWQT